MFAIPITGTYGTSYSWGYSDYIDLKRKHYDKRNLHLGVEFTDASTTGLLDVAIAVARNSSAEKMIINTGSGSTLVLSAVSRTNGVDTAPSTHFKLLTEVPVSGLTEPLRGVPGLYIYSRAYGISLQNSVSMFLMVG